MNARPEIKIIAGFPNHSIAEDGSVWNTKRGEQLSTTGEYPSLAVMHKGKRKFFYVSRLVASAFIPNPSNLPDVGYKDGNRRNLNANNLFWQEEGNTLRTKPKATVKASTGRLIGCTYLPARNRWESYITRNKRKHYLGSFITAEEAQAAYQASHEAYLKTPNTWPNH